MQTFKNIILLPVDMEMYDLELEKAISKINEKSYKRVLIQLPDGLKPKAKDIVDQIQEKTSAEVLIWQQECYGGCDIPTGLESLNIDFLIQWGHNSFKRIEGWG